MVTWIEAWEELNSPRGGSTNQPNVPAK